MKNLFHSIPKLFLVATFVAGLWMVGSYLIYESVGELRFALELQRKVEAEIAQNFPDNLKNPGERQQTLRNIYYGKWILGAMLVGSVVMILAGFAILFWPRQAWIQQIVSSSKNRMVHRIKPDSPLQA